MLQIYRQFYTEEEERELGVIAFQVILSPPIVLKMDLS